MHFNRAQDKTKSEQVLSTKLKENIISNASINEHLENDREMQPKYSEGIFQLHRHVNLMAHLITIIYRPCLKHFANLLSIE